MKNVEENNDNSFKIKLCQEWFKQGDVVIKETFPEKLKRFAEWMGFYSKYECKVLDEPVCHGDSYTYNLKPETKTIYWFYVPVYKITYTEDKPFDFKKI